MKVYVDADEMYPCYSVAETKFGICDEIEVDEQTYKRWDEAADAFYAAQEEIKAAIERARTAKIK